MQKCPMQQQKVPLSKHWPLGLCLVRYGGEETCLRNHEGLERAIIPIHLSGHCWAWATGDLHVIGSLALLLFYLKQVISYVKEIVQPKMKILQSFTHLQVVSNLYEFLLLNSFWFPLTPIVFLYPHYGSQWRLATVWLPTFLKISSFVFSRRNS